MLGKSRQLLMFALLLFVALIAYSNILNAYFLSDDFAQIGKVYEGDLSVTWGKSHGGFFRPLFILSYFIDAKTWGLDPLGFHLTNIAFHALNAFLVFTLANRLTRDARLPLATLKGLPLAAAFVFLLHPSHTEAVSWISGRADLLATGLCLLALLVYETFTRTRRTGSLLLSLALFALALLAKEAAICFPLIVTVFGAYIVRARSGEIKKLVFRPAALFFFVAVVYLLARMMMLGALIGGYGENQHLNFTHSTIISQLLRFSLRAIFPGIILQSATFLESRALSPVLIVTGSIVAVIAIIALSRRRTRHSLLELAKRNTFLWFMLALSICSLLPAINLRINVFDTQGERYLYLASAFFSIAFAYLLTKVGTRDKPRRVLLACLLLFYTLTLWQTNRNWAETAGISQEILNDITTQSTRDRLIILNLPDNHRGAYLYRNGLEQALQTFQRKKEIKSVHTIAFHRMDAGQDGVVLTEGADAVSLRPSNEMIEFDSFHNAPECIEILERKKRIMRLRVVMCAGEFDLFYFSEGRMHRVSEGDVASR